MERGWHVTLTLTAYTCHGLYVAAGVFPRVCLLIFSNFFDTLFGVVWACTVSVCHVAMIRFKLAWSKLSSLCSHLILSRGHTGEIDRGRCVS